MQVLQFWDVIYIFCVALTVCIDTSVVYSAIPCDHVLHFCGCSYNEAWK